VAESSRPGPDVVHEEIIRQLVTLVRSTAHLPQLAPPDGSPVLERPAFLLLIRLAEQGPLRVSALAGCLQVDLSTVSRQLTALESAGWVGRTSDPDDRRASLVRATEAGLAVLHANKEARRAAVREMLADWPEADRADFARLLARMNDSIAARRAAAPAAAAPAPVPTAPGERV